jgi:hypothetical protein
MGVDPACYWTCVGICAVITEGAGLLICIAGCEAACAVLDPG